MESFESKMKELCGEFSKSATKLCDELREAVAQDLLTSITKAQERTVAAANEADREYYNGVRAGFQQALVLLDKHYRSV